MGYLSVSFTFGIMASSFGFAWWQSVLISMLTVTSAGQFSGITLMLSPGHYLDMLINQITINVRYSFMSISVAQKLHPKFRGIWKWLFGFMMTDEIFAVSVQEEQVTRSFFAGLCVLPYIGWSVGTFLGAVLGNILPGQLMNALSVAIYGMFIAIVTPGMKKSLPVVFAVLFAAVLSCLFTYVPFLAQIGGGITITICAVIPAIICALLFPISAEGGESHE